MSQAAPITVTGPPGDRLRGRRPGERYLCFNVARRGFAIPIRLMTFVVNAAEVVPVSRQAASVRGLIELHQRAIPVVDLRVELGLHASPISPRGRVIVVDIGESRRLRVGLLVDSVGAALTFTESEIGMPRKPVVEAPLLGSVRVSGHQKLILDVERMITAERFNELECLLY
jgi:purine-binding chemotaxis protein CheW